MKILSVVPYFPYPPDDGGRIRTFRLLSHLARIHELTVIALSSEELPASLIAEADRALGTKIRLFLVPRGRNRITFIQNALLRGVPLYYTFCYQPRLQELIRQMATQVDAILVSNPYGILCLPELWEQKPLLICDTQNVEYVRVWRQFRLARGLLPRLLAFLHCIAVKPYERRALGRMDLTIAVSRTDEEFLRKIHSDIRCVIAENGTDLPPEQEMEPDPNAIVFVGSYNYLPNVDAVLYFAKEILPSVRERIPSVDFFAVGARPSPEVQALSKLPGVIVTGTIPSVTPYLHRAAVVVAPIRSGGGTRIKILEALAHGCAVVSTSLGCEGLPVKHGEHLLIADTPESFVEAVVDVLSHPAKARVMGERGRSLVIGRYEWGQVASRVREMIEELHKERSS